MSSYSLAIFFIAGVNYWWFTFIDNIFNLLFIVLVTLDIVLEVVVSFWVLILDLYLVSRC